MTKPIRKGFKTESDKKTPHPGTAASERTQQQPPDQTPGLVDPRKVDGFADLQPPKHATK